jgi:hypothetical protein
LNASLALPVQKIGGSDKFREPVTQASQLIGDLCIKKERLRCNQPIFFRKETFLRKPVSDTADSGEINRILHGSLSGQLLQSQPHQVVGI